MISEVNVCVNILLLLFAYTIIGIQGNSLLSGSSLIRSRREDVACGVHAFHCGNTTTCIEQYQVCDGSVDCEDGSDESNSCKRLRCPRYAFRCDYGGCINNNLVCNGQRNCRDGSDESEKNCPKDRRDTGDCTQLEFACDNGQCIDSGGKCDGSYDCLDKSDETSETCQQARCPPYAFRCDYGACINKNKKCNKVIDCVDESDEDPIRCGTIDKPTPTEPAPPERPQTPNSCALPEPPAHGKLVIPPKPDLLLVPGTYVEGGTFITEQCNKGFVYSGNVQYAYCSQGRWSRTIGVCVKTCEALVNTTKLTVVCTKDNLPVSCLEATGGTKAKFECAPFYEDPTLIRQPYRICRDGKWDQRPPICLPECGVKRAPPRILIVGGNKANKGDYPWQIAFYVEINGTQMLACGGALINEQVALTAAHCVTDDDGNIRPKEMFTIAAGKYYNPFNDPNDTDAQFSKVKQISVPREYRGEDLKYIGDIAILVAQKPFQLSHRVLPICVDWGGNYDIQLNTNGSIGIVTGWGLTTPGGEQAYEMKEIIVPYITQSECKSALPWDYVKYLTPDKMCSGFTNEGKGVCDGDSGGPLVFLNEEDKRYYVRGLVSLSPQTENSCAPDYYALYTMIKYHIRFISDNASVF